MVDIVTLQVTAYVAQIVGVIGTLTAAFIAVRSYVNANKRAEEARARELETRQAQLFMQIYNRFSDKDFVEAVNNVVYENPPIYKNFDEYHAKYIENNPEYDRMVKQIIYTLEGAGVLVNRGLIDVSYVDDLFSSIVIGFWESIKPAIVEARTRFNTPQIDEWLEYLYERVKDVAEKQHPELRDGIKRPVPKNPQ
jgi:hypothetical protein